MQHVNDDMDEIFRRAGKEYPLDTGGADWEKIAKELNIPAEAKADSGGSNRKLLWLLLLLPFSFICTQYFVDKGSHNPERVNMDRLTARPVPEGERNSKNDRNSNSGVGSQKADQYLSGNGESSSGETSGVSAGVRGKISLTGKQKVKRNIRKGNTSGWQDDWGPEATNNEYSNKVDNSMDERRPELLLPPSKPYPSLHILPAVAEQRNIGIPVSPKNKQPKAEKNKRLYAGVIGGVDATTVKFQKIENAGYDLGILLGYSFGKKWSIETGLLADKKFYYSDGEYFNTSKIYIPPNTKITSVEGNCNMWELPLSVRYNLKVRSDHSWFVTGGVSSYFMKKENYSYGYYYYSSGQTHYYDHSYESSSKTFFSVMQISGGYTRRLGKVADLRIEPYIKLPFRGVGIGSMPFQSAGIHIGLTKEIF